MRGLLVVDVQNDFCEGGSLAVAGGADVAAAITRWIQQRRHDYEVVLASRDWHDHGDNAGHVAATPDFTDTWPAHCVAGTPGAEYHPALDVASIDVHVRKGMGEPAYSLFEGVTDDGLAAADALRARGITRVDLVGIATDYCVLQSALGALDSGFETYVIPSLCAGVAPDTSAAAFATMVTRGVRLDDSVSATG